MRIKWVCGLGEEINSRAKLAETAQENLTQKCILDGGLTSRPYNSDVSNILSTIKIVKTYNPVSAHPELQITQQAIEALIRINNEAAATLSERMNIYGFEPFRPMIQNFLDSRIQPS